MIRQLPQPGDVIYVHRKWGIYQHYGVYIGDDGKLEDQVIHFSGKEKDIAFSEADIIQSSLEDFLKGGKLHIQKPNIKGWKPFATDEIIMRAKENVGKQKGEYSLPFNNCEHFANCCRFGQHKSGQVKRAITGALVIGVGIVGGIVATFIDSRAKNKSDHI